jgi:cytochrome c peroxidase
MHSKKLAVLIGAALLIALLAFAGIGLAQEGLSSMEQLGMNLYFDENLSGPQGQSCASCHDPDFGFDDPDSDLPVSEGVIPHRFGDRNSPMSAYAMYAPALHFDTDEGLWIGGQFWDGRATGAVLDDPLADQAIGPPLNPLEMANPNMRTYINAIKQSDYAELFEQVWGESALKDVETAYNQAGLAVAAFERTDLFAQFSSEYDYYLDQCLDAGVLAGDCAMGTGDAIPVAESIFTEQEWAGFQLFMNDINDNNGVLDEGEGAMCVLCHVADWTDAGDYELDVIVPDWAPSGMVPPLFTDFTFDNLGVPKNWDNPFLYMPPNLNPDGVDRIDLGLGGFLAANPDLLPEGYMASDDNGKFKVMTLRNLGVTAPYSHNGLFAELLDITHFYNTRDDPAAGWDAPEVPATINTEELGNLGLSGTQEEALVAFMMTLTDGYAGWGE